MLYDIYNIIKLYYTILYYYHHLIGVKYPKQCSVIYSTAEMELFFLILLFLNSIIILYTIILCVN